MRENLGARSRRSAPSLAESTAGSRFMGRSTPLRDPHDLLVEATWLDDTIGELRRVVAWLVGEAHDRGATWADVGQAFGVSAQAAHERFGANSRAIRRGDHGRQRDGHR